MMTANAATSAVAPAVPAAAIAVSPIASACSPSPAANKPAPVAATPTPISVNAPANAKILGIIGDNTAPATPIIANAPAKETKPLAIASQLIAPSILRTGANTAKDALAMSNAAEPANVPFIRFNAIDSSANAPPIVTSPLAISSHVKFPIVLRTFDNIVSAPATAIRPTPVDTIFLGIKLTANVISANAPAITVSPLPISSHCIEPKSSTADAIIFIAPAIAINAIPVDITCLALPVRFVNVAISASNMPILVRPFPISLHCIEPKSLQADANTFIAADSTRIPVAVDTAFPLNLAVFKNKAISAIRTPTPVSPLPSSPQLSCDISLQADANILTAVARNIRLNAPFAIVFSSFEITFATPANTPEITVIPVSPLAISFQLKDAIFFNADARISTETDNPNIIVTVFIAFLRSPLIFVKIAIDAISSANNPVNAVIADANFAESISESTTIAPVRIAIALAILIKVPAFNCV